MQKRAADESNVRASVERMVTEYAELSPFFLNPDEVVVKNIISGLVKNRMEYGYAYCPCKEMKGIPEEDSKNICPCRTHKEEIASQETCECGLFVSKAYFNRKRHSAIRENL
jgi:ferredoxin-thioredoxin reductase catalytic subunit